MSTPHIQAEKGQIAPTVLMPGDPLRAKYIADHFLQDVVQVNSVRNMLAFTGTYQGKPVTVFGSGMGMPSIGIYSYELYHFYDVQTIIRIGSCGGLQDDLQLMDIVIGISASTDSNYADQFLLPGRIAPTADFDLALDAVDVCEELGVPVKCGNILSSDIFYNDEEDALLKWKSMGVLAVEMEAAALYLNAARAGRRALCMLTVSDKPLEGTGLPSDQRETGFTQMMKVALQLL